MSPIAHKQGFSMMTSSNGSICRVTGPLCGEFTGHRWIPPTKASDAELWCFLLICAWINAWVNNREAGDLKRHCAHYDVIVMSSIENTYLYHIFKVIFDLDSSTSFFSYVELSLWKDEPGSTKEPSGLPTSQPFSSTICLRAVCAIWCVYHYGTLSLKSRHGCCWCPGAYMAPVDNSHDGVGRSVRLRGPQNNVIKYREDQNPLNICW